MLNLPDANDANWGTGSLVHRAKNCTGQTPRVPLMTLDAYCQSMPRVDFMKIDVEGAEHLVLRGGKQMLMKHHPAIIVERNTESEHEVVAMLGELGYQITSITGRRLTLPIDPECPRDILATWKDKP